MSTIVQAILPYLLLYKYYTIFVITFVAALAFPVPPGTLLMASAAFASQGYMSFWAIVFWGSFGNILGDNLGYWLARQYGVRVLHKIGFKKILSSPRYKAVELKILRRPGFFILVTRFEVFSNLAGNIIAGLARVPYRTYLAYEAFGEIAQVLLYASIGYFIGENWEYASGLISRSLLVVALIATLLILIFWKRITRQK